MERDKFNELLDVYFQHGPLVPSEIGKLVRDAYNEGFTEGMNEFMKHRSGGKSFNESTTYKRLTARAQDGER